jgi:hypothetical protein
MEMKMQLKSIAVLSVLAFAAIGEPAAIAYDRHAVQDLYTQAFRGYHDMRAQDALNFGRTDICPRYHSGWGGLYGDGDYPGSVDDNLGPPYLGDR